MDRTLQAIGRTLASSLSLVDIARQRAGVHGESLAYTYLADGELAEQHFTYGDLDRRARTIAAELQRAAEPGDRMLLLYEPGLEYVAAFYGCLYAGMVAVPAFPPEPLRINRTLPRLQAILADAQAALVLGTSTGLSWFEPLLAGKAGSARLLATDEVTTSPDDWTPVEVSGEDLAYVQYTSGSTGTPRGVMISHRNLLHNVAQIERGQGTSMVGVTWLPMYHDFGLVAAVLLPMYSGSRTISMSPLAFVQRPWRWLAAVTRFRGTIIGGPNFAYDLCVRKISRDERRELDLSSLSIVLNGAETVRHETLDLFAEAFAPCGFRREAFVPCYGLAEATLGVTGGASLAGGPVVERFEAEALTRHQAIVASNGHPTRALVSTGRSLERTEVIIVDPETHQERGAREVGEVWVRGPGVARGYWNRPDETASTFRAYLADGRGPYLRTGDLGFLHQDELFITGRLKELMILSGRNVYAHDVEETAGRAHPVLKADAAAAFSIEVVGEERLVIVQELKRTPKNTDLDEVFHAIRQAVLAEHDMPVFAIALIGSGTLPRTTSHKVQRRSCREAFLEGRLEPLFEWRDEGNEFPIDAEPHHAAPRTPTEIRLLDLWREVLRVETLSIHDSFFDIGGQSLLATQLVARIRREWQIDLPLAALFRSPTVASLAAEIDAAPRSVGEREAPVARSDCQCRMALSFAQQRLYFIDELAPGSTLNHLCVVARLSGPIDGDALWRSLLAVTERHQSLRTTFERTNDGPIQVIHEWQLPTLVEIDLRDAPADERERAADEQVGAEALRPFDLVEGPLWRMLWLQLADDNHRLVLAMHHIISDGWSMGVLLSELWQVYQAQLLDQPPPLAGLPVQYADYVAWQHSVAGDERIKTQLDYWRRQLAGGPAVLDLPTDRPRPALVTYRGSTRPIVLSPHLTAQVEALSQASGATPFVVLLASLHAVLHRYTGQTDICIGAAVANRSRPEFEPLIGFFVNLLPLRGDLSDDPTFDELMRRTRQTTFDAFDHQEVPFERLVEECASTRDASRSPLFQVALVVQNAPLPSVGGVSFEEVHNGAAKYDLTFALSSREGRLTGHLEYNTDLFDADTADRLIESWTTLLAAAIAEPKRRISQLPVMDEASQRRLLIDWSTTGPAPDIQHCLHELFEQQAAQTPDAVALVCQEQRLSYRELNERANRLARLLVEGSAFSVQGSQTVGICVERSLDTVVAILAVLKSGAAYLPLDPAWPTERLQSILGDATPGIVLTQQPLAERLAGCCGEIICLDDPPAELATKSPQNLATTATPHDLAYVIYTSGSTGKPKGVMVAHASVVALLKATEPLCGFNAGDVWTLFHSYAFDFSVWELWGALAYGGRLVVVPRATVRSADCFYQLLIDEQVTVLNQTPAAFSQLAHADEQAGPRADGLALRLVIMAGEMLDVSILSGWFERHGDQRPRLVNMYGITETTVHTTWRPLSRADVARAPVSPIGRPLPGWQVFVLDQRMQPVPVGVPGELYVGGAGLARGYFNRPDLTAERFLSHPFSDRLDARLYKSGDRVRWRADGELEYLGRLDQQVKIRGFRIELGEIEASLVQHPRVRDAAVIAREDQPGDKRLVAYVVPRQPNDSDGHGELRDWLQARLPDYMLPAAFVTLSDLPLTPNGKLDRRALPMPGGGSLAPRLYLAPRNGTEAELAAIWCELLNVDRVGVEDNFFDLGGHSLLAMQLMGRVSERCRAELPLRRLFEEPTVAGLARAIESIGRAANGDPLADRATWTSAIPRVARDEAMPLSFVQERLFFLEQLEPGSPTYNIPAAVRVEGRLDIAALHASLNRLVARHETLRTRFFLREGQAAQSIIERVELALPLIDLSHLTAEAQTIEIERLARQAASMPFDLSKPPLLRVQLLRLGDERHVFLVVLHHLIADGWSLGVLLRELAAGYQSHCTGTEVRLPALTVQYADYAAWQRQAWPAESIEKHLEYWRQALDGIPRWLEIPADRPRPSEPSGRGSQWTKLMPRTLVDRLQQLGRRHDATLYMTVLAAFEVLLGRLSGQDRFCLGTPFAGRLRRELEELIGLLVNTLVLPVDLRRNAEQELTFDELLERVKETTLAAFAHQELPFEKLVEHLQPERCSGRSPLFQVMFALQNAPLPSFDYPDLTIRPVEVPTGAAKFDLTLALRETSDGLEASWEFSTDLFDRATIVRWAGHFETLLEAIAEDPATPIHRLPLLTADERRQLLIDWNETNREYSSQRCVHELVAEQADRRPDAIAVVFENESLTYRELNHRANQLAHYLRSLGVQNEVRVGVALERGADLIVALVGITKAGGCYVPLDLDYPAQRLEFMLADAKPQVVLTKDLQTARRLAQGLGDAQVRNDSQTRGRGDTQKCLWINLDTISADLARHCTENPPPIAGPDNLAYILYTSGSTGTPKGIGVPHRAIVRLVSPMSYCPVDERDIVLHASPISFDASTFEIWGALARGATLVLASPGTPEIGQLVRRHRVSVLWLTAALFHTIVDDELDSLSGVRCLLAGGDVLSPEHVRQFVERFPQCRFINGYGPTEGTTFSCCHSVGRKDEFNGPVPIGRPIDNTQAYVLDEQMQPVPVGVPGELYLGGDGLARGYWNRPKLTAERFVEISFARDCGRSLRERTSGRGTIDDPLRLYKTGDRVRWRADGVLEFLGRLDQQIKIRGFRIEPGEIEAHLLRHPQVREAAVVARGDATGDRQLVAYVVPHRLPETTDEPIASATAEQAALRAWLQTTLPDYMLPAGFVEIDALPLTANGKVDRHALEFLNNDSSGGHSRLTGRHGRPSSASTPSLLSLGYCAPRNEIESAMAAIWSELLALERVGIHDNFFDLGGHSLLAMRVAARVRERFQIDLPLRRLFDAPTIASLAALLESCVGDEPAGAIARASRNEPLPLSFAQERLFFLDQLEPASPLYNVAVAVMLDGDLEVEALRAALDQVVARHETLRTRFYQHSVGPVQEIASALTLDVPLIDLSGLACELQTAEVERLAQLEARRPFDLSQPPLLRARLLRLSEQRHAFVLVVHHIVADGWSLGIFVHEVADCYQAHIAGEATKLPELALQYADFTVWQRQSLSADVLQRGLEYWGAALRDVPQVLDLPVDRPRPVAPTGRGSEVVVELPAALVAGVRSLARRRDATLYMTLLAAFQVLLGRLSGQDRFCLGTPVAGRTRQELEGLIGLFVNTLVLPVDAGRELTFEDLLGRVKETTLSAFAHQELPFEKLVEHLQPERCPGRSPLFQVMFALQNSPLPELALPNLSVRPLHVPSGSSQFDLTLSLRETGETMEALLQYSSDLFDRETIIRWAHHFETLLQSIVDRPQSPIDQLDFLSIDQRRQIIDDWNDTSRRCPVACLHELFADQAARYPDNVALMWGEQAMTYGELNARANQLAYYLRSLGVGPETRVALALERSFEMVVAVLGVLKAGGAYVPLDLNYPSERLQYMLKDAQPAVVLTQDLQTAPWLEQSLSDAPARTDAEQRIGGRGERCRYVNFDDIRAEVARQSTENPPPQAGPHHLAYVIYTSGSTGTPKGVAVEHRGWTNLAQAQAELLVTTPRDRVLQFASLSFDASAWEMSLALASGAALVLATAEALLPGEPLVELCRRQGVTIATLPPSILAALPPAELSDLRLIISAGEACRGELVRRWSKGRRFVNAYGPTETTVCATLADCTLDEPRPPIGRPLPNVRVFVLDRSGRPVPVGVPGELYVSGAGVARGYLNQPELTAERFIVDDDLGRLYRTGDLVRWRPDGQLEFLGRADQQVKLRGFRIEAGEIEAVLARHPQVREAAVIVREDQPGQPRLAAYVVAGGEINSSELRGYLQSKLPAFMIPASLTLLDALPVSANGKLDRRALPTATSRSRESTTTRAAMDETEQALAGIWRQILGLEQIAVDDNFFELGGDSIQTLAVVSQARQRGIYLTPRHIFEQPTIAGLAAVAATASPTDAEQDAVTGDVPLTPIQHWFFDRVGWALPTAANLVGKAHPTSAPLEAFAGSVNQKVLLELIEAIDPAVLEQAFMQLVLHHDALRLRFRREDDGWRQFHAGVEALPTAIRLEQVDHRGLSSDEQDAELRRLLEQIPVSFDLESGPLAAAVLITTNQAQRLLLVIHHLVVDTVSWRILLEDLLVAYQQIAAGQSVRLPLKTTSLRQWAVKLADYASDEVLLARLNDWHDLLARPSGCLPRDFTDGINDQASAATIEASLGAHETHALLAEVVAGVRMPMDDVLLAAFSHTLRPIVGDALVIDVEGHGRESDRFDGVDLSRTVGWFTSLYPVRLELGGGSSPTQSVSQAKEQLREARRRGFDYGVCRYLSPNEAAVPGSPAEICFNYLGQHIALPSEAEKFARIIQLPADPGDRTAAGAAQRPYLVEVTAEIREGRLTMRFTYSRNVFRAETIQGLCDNLLVTLRELIAASSEIGHVTPADFPLAALNSAELTRLVGDGRNVEDIYPLSPLQLGMLYHCLAGRPLAATDGANAALTCGAYLEQLICGIQGPLDPAAFRQIWRSLVERHGVLRTRFAWLGLREPLAIVARQVEVPWSELDWSDMDELGQAVQLEALLLDDRRRGFDLSAAPLLRVTLIRLGQDTWRLVWTHHHLLLDGWSLPLLVNELLIAYESALRGQKLSLPTPRRFRDFIAWLGKQDRARAEAHWRGHLRGFTAPTPLCFEPPEACDESAPIHSETRLQFSAQITCAAEAFARRHQLTVNTLLQATWAVVLGRHARLDEVVYGTTVAGRPASLAGAESMIGLFINTLPIRVRIADGSTVRDWLRGLQRQLAESRQHEQTPLASIRGWSDILAGTPLFESLFVFENYPVDAAFRGAIVGFRSAKARLRAEEETPLSGLQLTDIESRSQTNFPLNVVASPGERISLRLNYDVRRFSQSAMESLAAEFEETLASLVADGERSISDLACACGAQTLCPSATNVPYISSGAVRSSAGRSSSHRDPRTETEQILADIWREVLGLQHVGVDDNFFEIGGDSIQAVRIMSLAAARGRSFPPQAIFEHPNIAALAAAVDGAPTVPGHQHSSCLVAIRATGNKPPLVCIHPVGGTVFPYYLLAHHLGPDQPVYAIQSRGLADGESQEQIEEMAAHYLSKLRTIQATGPYCLAGWSFGGIIAYEMARHVAASGESPPKLILIDSGVNTAADNSAPQAGFAALLGLYNSADHRPLVEVESLDPEQKLHYFAEQIVAAGLAPPQLTSADAQRLLTVFEANARAGLAYRPRPAPLRAVLFRATEHAERNDRDPTLGWGTLLQGGLDIEPLPGDHLTLLREPHIRTLAERLMQIIH